MELQVVEIDPWGDPRWEDFAVAHPDGTVYHHPSWLQTLQREYRQKGVYLACHGPDGTLLGILPLLYTRGFPLSGGRPLTGPRLSSLPRTPMAGPLAVNPAAAQALLREAQRRAAADPSLRLQIKPHAGEPGGSVQGIARKPWRQSYVIRLAGKPGSTYTIPDTKTRGIIRRGINKAINSGVRTRMAESEADLRQWYRIYLETMRRNMVPARPYRLFLAMWELMRPKGIMRLALAEYQAAGGARIIGGHVYFHFGRTVTYSFSATRASDFALRPNDVLLGQAIEEASQAGFHFVDLGEVPDGDDNLAQYKIKWGAETVRLYRYYYPDFEESAGTEEAGQSGLHRMAAAVWNRVPLGLTCWIGDRVYARL